MIWRYEIRKILRNPILWTFLGLCFLFNLLLICSELAGSGPELEEVHDILLEDGTDEKFYEEYLALYDDLDMNDIKELKEELADYHPAGSYGRFIDRLYETLNERVEEIKSGGEAEGIIYPGYDYRLYSRFFGIFRILLLEMAVIMVMAVLYLMDYERINHTSDLTCMSCTGRSLFLIKWISGMAVGMFSGLALLAGTITFWFIRVPYEGFWDVSVSAAMMAEPRSILYYPFITFQEMSVRSYLLSAAGMGLVLVLVCGLLAGGIQMLLKNSYLSFLAEAVLLFLLFAAGFVSTATWADVLKIFNPSILWYCCSSWFMEGDFGISFPGAEIIGGCVQCILAGSIGYAGYAGFRKSDIVL